MSAFASKRTIGLASKHFCCTRVQLDAGYGNIKNASVEGGPFNLPKRTGLSKVGAPAATIGLQDRDITIAPALNHLSDLDQ